MARTAQSTCDADPCSSTQGIYSAPCHLDLSHLRCVRPVLLQVGDVLLAAAFVSYAGPFNMTIRQQLVEQKWRPDLIERCIPLTDGVKPLDLLTGKQWGMQLGLNTASVSGQLANMCALHPCNAWVQPAD